jgi:hypothetical protein
MIYQCYQDKIDILKKNSDENLYNLVVEYCSHNNVFVVDSPHTVDNINYSPAVSILINECILPANMIFFDDKNYYIYSIRLTQTYRDERYRVLLRMGTKTKDYEKDPEININ